MNMKLARPSFVDHLFRWQPRLDICGRGAPDGIYARKSFRRAGQAGVPLVSKSSGTCGSVVVRRGVSFALVGDAVEELSVFGYELAATARVLSVFVYVLSVFLFFCP